MKKIISIIGAVVVLAGSHAHAKWALVVNGSVHETWASKPDFNPEVMRSIYSVSNNVEAGWRKVGDNYLPPKTKEEKEIDAFDAKRVRLQGATSMKARKQMAEQFLYKLTGDLATGYPDKTQPLCVTMEGETLTLENFMDYIQMKDDDGATQPELQDLKQQAKAARRYFKTLKP